MQLVCETQEQFLDLKERAMKSKVIALEQMDKHPLLNPSSFSKRDKKKLMDKMSEIMEWSEEKRNEEFNSIVNDRLLGNGMDLAHYPIYDTRSEEEKEADRLAEETEKKLEEIPTVLIEE